MCAEVPCLPFSLWHTVECVCACACVSACAHMHGYMHEVQTDSGCPATSLPYSFAAGAVTEPGARLVASQLQCLHGIQVTGTHGSSWFFTWEVGFELGSSCLLTKCCYPLIFLIQYSLVLLLPSAPVSQHLDVLCWAVLFCFALLCNHSISLFSFN